MRFLIEGLRRSNNEVKYYLDDYDVARFEFDCLTDVCSYVTLYQDDKGRLKQLKLYIDK